MKIENRGGSRSGSGRPATNQKTFTVRCNPNHIHKVREYAKKLANEIHEKTG